MALRLYTKTLLLALALGAAMPLPAAPPDVPCPDRENATDEQLAEHTYEAFGTAATDLSYRGERLDRLSVLARLATETDPAARRELFLALAPVWHAVNGNGGADSPWRSINCLQAAALREAGTSSAARAAKLGVDPVQVVPWLEAILAAWRTHLAERDIEPWDYYFEAGEMERSLAGSLPLSVLRPLNDRIYQDRGADPTALGIEYDLAPHPGKDPVAYTDFVERQRQRADGTWERGRYHVSASYAVGGVGNFAELLHETGHGIHIAAIRAAPGLVDWPDSDVLTEALADLVALDLYDPAFQQHYLGTRVPARVARKAKYAGIVLDTAWALFELRMQADPALDPNQVWSDLTSRYLRIRPHPEWSWWAMRGQLVSNPGYMLNYALGAIVIADLRARARALWGPSPWNDPGWYGRASQGLLRFGLDTSPRVLVEDFLGRPVTPDALLEDLSGQ